MRILFVYISVILCLGCDSPTTSTASSSKSSNLAEESTAVEDLTRPNVRILDDGSKMVFTAPGNYMPRRLIDEHVEDSYTCSITLPSRNSVLDIEVTRWSNDGFGNCFAKVAISSTSGKITLNDSRWLNTGRQDELECGLFLLLDIANRPEVVVPTIWLKSNGDVELDGVPLTECTKKIPEKSGE